MWLDGPGRFHLDIDGSTWSSLVHLSFVICLCTYCNVHKHFERISCLAYANPRFVLITSCLTRARLASIYPQPFVICLCTHCHLLPFCSFKVLWANGDRFLMANGYRIHFSRRIQCLALWALLALQAQCFALWAQCCWRRDAC